MRLLDDLAGSTEAAYRFSVRARDAGLREAAQARRARLEAWLEDQLRAERGGRNGRDRTHFQREAEKRAAYTLLNRLVLLRLMEGMGLRKLAVLSGGWDSEGYRNFREIAPALVRGDESEGYAYLLELVFEELALELPGLYGSNGVADLIPVGPATLRHLVESLDDPALASCWTDDMTLGWVYQYWNDPEREALDAKLHAGGKVEPHEIASKTQMFTERYMVDWLLQNSLGPMWLAMCRKQGWVAECEQPLPGEPAAGPVARPTPVGWAEERSPTPTDADANANAKAPEDAATSVVVQDPGRCEDPPTQISAEVSGPGRDVPQDAPLGVVPQPDLRESQSTEPTDTTQPLTGLLRALHERRADWRGKRERGEVALTDLMPLLSDAERRWAYYVPQPIPADAIATAPDSVRDLKLLDPAVGSGHFLVVAFVLLFALYKEEARHRGESGDARWSDRKIVERILTHNLHGIDLDPRAVQIAAAALWLKARCICPEARPARLNLVASSLRLAGLPDTAPALMALRRELERESGIPAHLTDTLIQALAGADHLGSLLKIDSAVDEALRDHEASLNREPPRQLSLGLGAEDPAETPTIGADATPRHDAVTDDAAPSRVADRGRAKADILERMETFLAHHTGGEDLGLRLHGEQLAAGVRFVRMLREGQYDLVFGNPPYQGTSKMADADYVKRHYPLGKADLYAVFLIRGLQLAREGGTSALLTMRNWMFTKQYAELRVWLLEHFDLRALGDFDRGAFEEVLDEVVSVVVSVLRKVPPLHEVSIAIQPTPMNDRSRDSVRTRRKRAATICSEGFSNFEVRSMEELEDRPLIYWWPLSKISEYAALPTIGQCCPAKAGLQTANDTRFLRRPWEINYCAIARNKVWAPYLKGAENRNWIEPLSFCIRWVQNGIDIKVAEVNGKQAARPQNEAFFFRPGIAINTTGSSFGARLHRHPGIFGDKGRSLFPGENRHSILCALNSSRFREDMESLNPTIDFTVGDVNRLPAIKIESATLVVKRLERSFEQHESGREPSVEFKHPAPSPWRYAQSWAQTAVDRPERAPLPTYDPEYDPEPPTNHLSFALGVALGRFGGGSTLGGEGILDPTSADLAHALPAGILFLDGTQDANEDHDGLGDPAASVMKNAWAEHGAAIDARSDLRTWLRLKCFKDVHRTMYENRPIHWPLSSGQRTFVAWINIHRWDARTLRVLLADHLYPAAKRIDGELADLRAAREGAERRAAETAERRFALVMRWRDELAAFIADVEQCAERGAPPTDARCPVRERDAIYAPDLDDGAMINSAALWPLLEPQWKDPKKWWKELATASGKKDYDWSHLAMRYWPERVDAKCRQDPSLGVAHGCFWAYHPARAWAWELRLQDEIAPDFRIEESPYRGDGGDREHRATYLAEQWQDALAAITKEVLRRRRKKKAPQPELTLLEPGLWSEHPAECRQIEIALITKQATDFHLRAPDETDARAAFEQAHPEQVAERETLLMELRPINDLLAGEIDETVCEGAEDSP
ncbi:BREX-6 system adenine-specific DNA-methyltransferase PglX [Thiocapsa sp.]|uniref:BREX-6 system adenine-specific DNA-methyltransferase PglX n=1 Tax=Thiocapsa sp. TaxID=2024551 RepID=UPI0035947DDD